MPPNLYQLQIPLRGKLEEDPKRDLTTKKPYQDKPSNITIRGEPYPRKTSEKFRLKTCFPTVFVVVLSQADFFEGQF